jgi:hypothetical protein
MKRNIWEITCTIYGLKRLSSLRIKKLKDKDIWLYTDNFLKILRCCHRVNSNQCVWQNVYATII